MSEIKLRLEKPKVVAIILAVLFIILAGVFFTGQMIARQYQPVDPADKTMVDIVIPEKTGARQVADLLYNERLIHKQSVFLAYCQKNGYDSSLKAGHYRFSRSQSLKEIVDDLVQGRIVNISFTIPEGYTLEQIGRLLIKKQLCSQEEWNMSIRQDYDFAFLKALPLENENRLEGFLYPETYFVPEDYNCQQVIVLMLNNFEQVWQKKFAEQAQAKNWSVYHTITLASLIEKEAQVPEERAMIAGVILNRLNAGMLLQIDASVLYALQRHKELVTYADLEVNSPYNTYKYAGLPPGPIACPGEAAINAALNPQEHSYYYYVSKGDGSHFFSRTYSEHLQAQKKYGQ